MENLNYVETAIIADLNWFREFAGLFWGEGSAMIVKNNSSFGPVLCVRLRDDDAELIRDLQEHLGGRILHSYRSSQNPNHGDMIEWRATNLDHCIEIAELLLRLSGFPAKKKTDVRLVLDFCVWRKSLGRYFTPEQRLEAERRYLELRTSRLYSVVKVQG